MGGFLGKYEYQMDPKGRVSLPSAFRREAEGDRFVLLQWEKPYLCLYTLSIWSDMQNRLLDFRRRNPEAENTVREIVGNASEVEPDKQGRILVPGFLKEAAQLDATVLLTGNIDRVELWNPKLYQKIVRAAPTESVQSFVRQVFG